MTILQKPDALSLSGNLRPFIVESSEDFTFVLSKGSQQLLAESYRAGRVEIDIKDAVEQSLGYIVNDMLLIYEQTNIVASFTVNIGEETPVTFRCLRGGVADLSVPAATWLKANYLTWQPTQKHVTYSQPEWITYYAVVNSVVRLKAYFEAGEPADITLPDTLTAGHAYTLDMIYGTVSPSYLTDRKPLYYELWIEDMDSIQLTYKQIYLADNTRSRSEQWFLWENSLGGLDTFRATGRLRLQAQHSRTLTDINRKIREESINTEHTYTKNTGLLDNPSRRWLLDFFPARKKWLWCDGKICPIVVTADNAQYDSETIDSSYTFDYRFSDAAEPLLNLSRDIANIEDIIIPIAPPIEPSHDDGDCWDEE